MADNHTICEKTFQKERKKAEFANARVDALVASMRELAHKLDGIGGHTTYPELGNKTLGGAVRWIIIGEESQDG